MDVNTRNKTLVAFEKLYLKSGDDKVEIDKHEEIDDEDQSVHHPDVYTTATDKDTQSHTGVVGETVIDDKVILKNLVKGYHYKVTGTLMDKETGDPILVDGKKYVSTVEFVADDNDLFTVEEESGNRVNGYIHVYFSVHDLKGIIVVFEKLLHVNPITEEEVELVSHEDINDEEQSIYYPEVYTTAVDEKTGGHAGTIAEEIKVYDHVYMKNLVIGKEYTVSGTLRYQDNGTLADGTRVYAKNYGKRCFVFEADGRKKKSKDYVAGKNKKAERKSI